MKTTKNVSGKEAIVFDSLSKEELQNVYGGGKFVFNPRTRTMYYIVCG